MVTVAEAKAASLRKFALQIMIVMLWVSRTSDARGHCGAPAQQRPGYEKASNGRNAMFTNGMIIMTASQGDLPIAVHTFDQ